MDDKQPPRRYLGDFASCNWCDWVERRIEEQDKEIAHLKRQLQKVRK